MSQPPFPPEMPEGQQPSEPPVHVVEPPRHRFSPAVTAVMAAMLIVGIGFFAWLQVTIPPLERVAIPEVALPWVVGRTLDAEEATARASPWERFFYQVTSETHADELNQAIRWYRELADATQNAQVHLELAILEAEHGEVEEVRRRIGSWRVLDAPFPLFADMVQAAYITPPVDRAEARTLLAKVAEILPAGWFYDRIAMRLAAKAGDEPLLESIDRGRSERIMPLLEKIRILTVVESTTVALGLLAVVRIVRGGSRISTAPIPPPWRGRLGMIVLIRGGAMAVVLTVAALFLDGDDPFIRLWTVPLASLPVFAMAHRHLLQPHGHGFITGLGLRPFPGAWPRTVLAVLAVLAVGLSGEWIIGLVADWFDVVSHWTEWFDADLVWGGPDTLFVTLMEFVVIAPAVEEMMFRGLLFGTLRRRFGLLAAGMISAGLFAVAHGYGMVGFASVFLSGLLWAWIYERTGSLVPGMLAHALNNLLVCASTITLLRP